MTNEQECEILFKSLAECNIHRYKDDKKLYKYTDIDTAKKIFNGGTIKFSNAEELGDNDLEMALLNFNLSPERQKERLESVYIELYKMGYYKFDKDKDCIQMLKNSYKSLHRKVGFFCATTSNSKSEMWNSKYADFEKGVCIEYTIPLFNPHYYTFKVFYDKEFKPFNLFDNQGSEIEVSVQRWYFTKRIQYEFEDEVRIFYPYNCGIFSVDKRIFTGLYYGKKTLQTDIEELELLIKKGCYAFPNGFRANY